MNCKFHVRVSVALDVSAFDTADAWELLNAWADALREGDFEGLQHLDSITRVRPSFALADVKQMSKPPVEPDAVHILDPTSSNGTGFCISR